MAKGTVKFFNTEKKFGFIQPSDKGPDIFVHQNGLIDNIKEDDEVEFEIENTPKGLSAIDVKVVS